MNSDIEIRLHLDESSSWDPARNRFLESLGFGHALLSAEPSRVPDEVEDEDGVVLSSQPDDFDLPVPVNEVSPQRATSFSGESSFDSFRREWLSIPAEGGRAAAEEVSVPIVPVKAVISPHAEERLHHHCPQCDGELVLQRRHLGVEGLCVWCHCPIVAAESARDSHVRLFSILGRSAKLSFRPAESPGSSLAVEPAGAAWPDFSPLSFSPTEAVCAITPEGLDDSKGNVSTPPAPDFAGAFQMTGFDRPAGQADLGCFFGPEEKDSSLHGSAKAHKNDFASAFASPGVGFIPPLSPSQGTVAVEPKASLLPAPAPAPGVGGETAEAPQGTFGETPQPKKAKAVIRRGTFALIFVILGLTVGTALASLVLPVDDYVQAARALMERHFSPSSIETGQ